MKKFALIFLPILLFADLLVQTAMPKLSQKVYLGSFLANGHLPPKYIFEMDAFLEGEIENVYIKPFAAVKKGQKILSIKSPKLLELESTFIENYLQQLYFAKELQRLKPLIKEAIVAKRRYLEVKNKFLMYKAKANFYAHLLSEWGIGEKELQRMRTAKMPISAIDIKAPIDGRVAKLDAKSLMYVQTGDHLVTIIDPTKTHLEVALPLEVVRYLHKKEKIYVDDKEGFIESIAPEVDPATQSVAVHIVVKGMKILPNQRLNVRLYIPKKALVIASSALIEVDGKEGVFVKEGKQFHFVPVRVLARTAKEVYFLSPTITTSTPVAVTGVIALKGSMEASND